MRLIRVSRTLSLVISTGCLIITLIAGVSVTSIAAAPASSRTKSPNQAKWGKLPTEGALFGAAVAVGDRTGPTQWEATLNFEEMIGRSSALEREYFAWDEVFPTANEYLSRDRGRTLILSWGAANSDGTEVTWADIAAGVYDDVIDARAADVKAFRAPMFFVFHHEPNGRYKAGTPQEFVDAFRHVHDRFKAAGARNAKFTLVMFDSAFETGTVDEYYPGDEYLDFIGVDAYNWYQCPDRNDSWDSFEEIVTPFHDFGVAHHKRMIIAEWGSNEDSADPNRKATWITEAAATLKTWGDVKGVSYYNNGPPSPTCNWWVDSSPQSLAAFQAIGSDPYFNPSMKSPPKSAVTAYVNAHAEDFSSANGFPVQGRKVKWLPMGAGAYSVTDSSGLGLFDSGVLSEGSSWSYSFSVASNYTYLSLLDPLMTGTIKVPVTANPEAGDTSTEFTLRWASAAPTAGYTIDVQVMRPGESSWSFWLRDTVTTMGTFVPDSGPGTYSFRAQLLHDLTGTFAGWSTPVTITVD